GVDLTSYMEASIRDSDVVLLICTPRFAEKANLGHGGVGYEKSIVTGEIFSGVDKPTKFVPVLREGDVFNAIPSYLKSRVFVDFRSDRHRDKGLEELLRNIHRIPRHSRPSLGEKPVFDRALAPSKMLDEQPVEKTSNVLSSAKAPGRVTRFDIAKFTALRDFAFSVDGLDLTRAEADAWAHARLDNPRPFDIARFKELRDFAFSPQGLDLLKAEATAWAQAWLDTAKPFDIARFKELRDFAFSPNGLDLTTAEAIRWAMNNLEKELESTDSDEET
ncbi:MAG TPA: hypothetical protein VJQ25_04755, partial [Nitrospira sp.]|nr:hypothetical protein [Nitrospira sp.]